MDPLDQPGILGYWYSTITAGAVGDDRVALGGVLSVTYISTGLLQLDIDPGIEFPYGVFVQAVGGSSAPGLTSIVQWDSDDTSNHTLWIRFRDAANALTDPAGVIIIVTPT